MAGTFSHVVVIFINEEEGNEVTHQFSHLAGYLVTVTSYHKSGNTTSRGIMTDGEVLDTDRTSTIWVKLETGGSFGLILGDDVQLVPFDEMTNSEHSWVRDEYPVQYAKHGYRFLEEWATDDMVRWIKRGETS